MIFVSEKNKYLIHRHVRNLGGSESVPPIHRCMTETSDMVRREPT